MRVVLLATVVLGTMMAAGCRTHHAPTVTPQAFAGSVASAMAVASSGDALTSVASASPEPKGVAFDSIGALDAVSDGTVWIAVGATLMVSRDEGHTWERLPDPPSAVSSLDFVDPVHGFAIDEEGLIKTLDGGRTWRQWNRGLRGDVQFVDQQDGWVSDGDLLRTTDGGVTWNAGANPCGTHERAIYGFYSVSGGWAACGGQFATIMQTSQWFFRSDDGGVSWKRIGGFSIVGTPVAGVPALHVGAIVDVFAIDESCAWFGSIRLPATTLGCRPERSVGETDLGEIRLFVFPSGERGYALLRGQELIATTDGGASWCVRYTHEPYRHDFPKC